MSEPGGGPLASPSSAASPEAVRAPAADVIERTLREGAIEGVALHLFDELPSTNCWLEENLERIEAPRALCAADRQSAGRARRERGWVSECGNVALSLLTHLPAEPSRFASLSLVTGVAVASVLRERTALEVRLKWPNDIVLDGAKLGGLLATMRPRRSPSASGEPRLALVSGIGLNLVHDERLAALGIGGTSLEAVGASAPARDELLGHLAVSVFGHHERFLEEGWAGFADEWRELDWLAGQSVDVHGPDGVERGLALGVHEDGALRVRIDGRERALYGGEVSVRPRKGGTR